MSNNSVAGGAAVTPQNTSLEASKKPKPKVPEAYYTKYLNNFRNVTPALRILYDDAKFKDAIKKAKEMGDRLQDMGCTPEHSYPLSLLTLYDIVLLLDDSSSMEFEQDGKRKEILQQILEEITKIYDLANDTGITSVKFINDDQGRKDVTHAKIESIFKDRLYEGDTRIGTMMNEKVLEPFVWEATMQKPLLVMTITDGEVEGEMEGLLKHYIADCAERVKVDPKRGERAVAFHFSRVGDDEAAQQFLEHLDDCDEVGEHVDCVQAADSLEQITDPFLKWRFLCKFFLGAIDPKWDEMEPDEIRKDVKPTVYNQPKKKKVRPADI